MNEIKPLSHIEQEWFEKLRRRYPDAKEGNLRKDARLLAKGRLPRRMRGKPAQPARAAGSSNDGLPDGAAYWSDVKGQTTYYPAKAAKPAVPPIDPETLV